MLCPRGGRHDDFFCSAGSTISGDELADFIYIQEELERISVAVETLQLWSERMLATGAIDAEQYRTFKANRVSGEG